jgi:VanZ family protein
MTPPSGRKKALLAWAPALLWSAVIFGLSSIPGKDLPQLPGWWSADKFVHGGVYGVLGAFLWLGLRTTWARESGLAWQTIAAALGAALYGITDEMHQSFTPGRSPDVFDVLADFVGGLLGALACVAIVARRRARDARLRGAEGSR